ncbi:MAG: hypothetical protein EXR53_05210 [Dehalococcoidia bacterium]|nr:hypothetical protein [Dehalococcoidia bacterium]
MSSVRVGGLGARPQIHQTMVKHFAARPAAEWAAKLKAERQFATVVNEIDDLYDDPQVIANDMIIQFEQPGIGMVKAVNAPFRMSEHLEDERVHRPAPGLGQHTQEVLQELGYSLEAISALKQSGIVA